MCGACFAHPNIFLSQDIPFFNRTTPIAKAISTDSIVTFSIKTGTTIIVNMQLHDSKGLLGIVYQKLTVMKTVLTHKTNSNLL